MKDYFYLILFYMNYDKVLEGSERKQNKQQYITVRRTWKKKDIKKTLH